jgi:predicted RND superfamily exporter protein
MIEWILSRRRMVLAVSLVVAVAGGLAAARLPIKADFSALLPPSTESVQHLEAIQERVRAFGTAYILVEADDPDLRRRAAEEVRAAVERLDRTLVTRVTIDDGPLRRFVWHNRYLFVEEGDLEQARAALEEKIKSGKLRANPLYIDLDDEESEGAGSTATEPPDPRLEDLRKRLAEAESEAATPRAFVSRDGRLQLLIVQASFPAGQISRTRVLAGELQRIIAELQHRHPDVRVGMTGDVATTLSEQRSILYGMLQAAAVTVLLVTLLLLVTYRSIPAIGALLWGLAVGTLATLGLTKLFIGHFNIATAFLSAIVVGNGINPGIILLSRYRDELRRGDREGAVARAMAGAARGSLTASLTAAVAYASLAVTDFRGFRHFGVIGGIGMALCWLSAFTVLPAALSWLNDRRAIRFRPSRVAHMRLARLIPRSPVPIAVVGLLLTFAAGWGAYRYLSGEPLENDWRKLRSDSAEILQQRAWNDRIGAEIPRGAFNRNLSGRFAVVLDRRDQVGPLVEELRARDRALPPERTLLAEMRSLDDALPKRQVEKLALLSDIRRLIDDELIDEVKDEDREELLRLRPPDTLRPIADRDVPEELAWPFIERDGTVGRIVFASNSNRFDSWNVSDLVQFSDEVRELELPEGALIGGQAFVFADMLRAMERDAPRAILLSLLGSTAIILLLLGRGRHGLLTILATLAGTAGMIALAGAVGLKVNFLDFIALPITIGIGADYAANIAARELDEPHASMSAVLLTSGGAVLLCSLTTVIGYGSLLVSDNAGIRSFGLAAILGEATCLAAALLLCPALLWLLRGRGAGSSLPRRGDHR